MILMMLEQDLRHFSSFRGGWTNMDDQCLQQDAWCGSSATSSMPAMASDLKTHQLGRATKTASSCIWIHFLATFPASDLKRGKTTPWMFLASLPPSCHLSPPALEGERVGGWVARRDTPILIRADVAVRRISKNCPLNLFGLVFLSGR